MCEQSWFVVWIPANSACTVVGKEGGGGFVTLSYYPWFMLLGTVLRKWRHNKSFPLGKTISKYFEFRHFYDTSLSMATHIIFQSAWNLMKYFFRLIHIECSRNDIFKLRTSKHAFNRNKMNESMLFHVKKPNISSKYLPPPIKKVWSSFTALTVALCDYSNFRHCIQYWYLYLAEC